MILWGRSASAGVASPVDIACVQSVGNILNMQTIYAENELIVADSLLKVKFNAVFKSQKWSQLSMLVASESVLFVHFAN